MFLFPLRGTENGVVDLVQVDVYRLLIGVEINGAVAALVAEAGGLHTAEGGAEVANIVGVQPDHAGLERLREGDPVIQTVRDAWERPVRAVLRSKGIGDEHFDHALFLYNQIYDPREVLDLVAEGMTMAEAMRFLTQVYYGALDGMVGARR